MPSGDKDGCAPRGPFTVTKYPASCLLKTLASRSSSNGDEGIGLPASDVQTGMVLCLLREWVFCLSVSRSWSIGISAKCVADDADETRPDSGPLDRSDGAG